MTTIVFEKTNGEKIRILRERMGITQVEMANLLEVDERTIQRWENGHRNCSNAMLMLAKLLKAKHSK